MIKLDKLEIGMYVRYISSFHNNENIAVTKIDKIVELNNDYIVLAKWKKQNGCYPIENFKKIIIGKPSFNPIDLIEVGDYVNGYKVESDDLLGEYIVIFEAKERKYKRMYLGRINTDYIVTKEQFDSMKYEIGG